jgi:hypothetical protein
VPRLDPSESLPAARLTSAHAQSTRQKGSRTYTRVRLME